MMTNLLCGLVEREVHCQTNRDQKLKILQKVHLPSLCTTFPMSITMEKKENVVIDYEGSKRLVHIYGVGKIKIWSNKIMVWRVNQGYSLVIVYFNFI